MICYHDMTFCGFYISCVEGADCRRRLSDAVLADSKKIGIPVAQFAEPPDCYSPFPNPIYTNIEEPD